MQGRETEFESRPTQRNRDDGTSAPTGSFGNRGRFQRGF